MLNKTTGAVLVALLLFSTAGSAQKPTSVAPPGGSLPLFEAYLESLRQQAGIPGMSGTIIRDGAVIWERGFGYANVAAHIAASPDTPYLAGDLSQTIASTLLLQCVDQRRLDLDAPLSTYGLNDPEPTATLRQLLSHQPADGAKDFVYNPSRFDALTALMEWCAPQPYRKSVAHRIFDGLAMKDSVPGTDLLDPTVTLSPDLFAQADVDGYHAVLANLAVPYRVDSKQRATPVDVPQYAMTASNGMVTTVRDLANFDEALDTPFDSGGLLGDDTKALAWTPAVGRSGSPIPMGLGWFVQPYKGATLVWHFSDVPGAYSAIYMKMPSRNTTLILLANSDGLTAPFQLAAGDVTKSLFVSVFLKLFT